MSVHIIKPKPAPQTRASKSRQRVAAVPRPAELLACNRCGGIELQPVVLGMTYRNGKASGGAKQWLCAGCNRRGERVVIA